MSDKKSGCLALSLFLALCVSLLINVGLFSTKVGNSIKHSAMKSGVQSDLPSFDETVVQNATSGSGDRIAVIEIRGVISSSAPGRLTDSMVDDAKVALRQATNDENVRAIVLHIDSPGGEVTASDVIYNEVRAARQKKKVVVYMGSVAASGGYYIACGGDYLMANETTITGSIGVIMHTLKYKDLFGKIGVESVVFKSGQFKDILSGSRDMTEPERAYIQAMVMQTYDKFVGIVASERKIDEAYLRTNIADGRIISGKDAVGSKLINATGYIEDAYNKARELANSPNAAIVEYKAKFRFGNLLRSFGAESKSNAKVEVSLGEGILPHLESGRLYLLPSFYAE
ncbi:MAG: signal peptide peptidase SppA [Chthoniobacterales bacterium]